MKVALVDGTISPELFQRLESMGFEIVDMNDRDAMKALRERLKVEESLDKMHDATGLPIIALRGELSKIQTEFPMDHVVMPMLLKAMEIEPMPDIRIDKTQDRFSPFDKFVGRGKGRAKSQGFSKHFKHS